MVSDTDSAGVDITFTIGLTAKSSTSVKIRDNAINKVIVFPMASEVCFLFWAPMDWPILTVAPIASPTIITVIMCITWLPMETAVVLFMPLNCPMINKSAMPYNVCKK